MLKRIFFFLLVPLVILLLVGFKLLSWRPDIVASVTGKEFLLNTPLVNLVDLEKLYSLPEGNVDVALLKVQMEDIRSSQMQPAAKDRKLAELTHKIGLLTGKVSVQSIEDAKLLYIASEAPYSKSGSETAVLNKFVYWEGPYGFIADDYYFITRSRPDPTQASSSKSFEMEGFSLHRVRKWFTDSNLQPGTELRVVGRYAGTSELRLANGQNVLMPLLEDCYVDRKP